MVHFIFRGARVKDDNIGFRVKVINVIKLLPAHICYMCLL